LDYTQKINFIYPTESIAVPTVTLSSNLLDTDIKIDPTAGIRTAFKTKIQSGNDLKQAKRQDGSPLLRENFDATELDEIATKMTQTLAAGDDLVNASPAKQQALTSPQLQESVDGGAIASIGNALGDIWHSVKKGFTKVTNFIVNKVKEGIQFVIEIGGKIYKWVAQAVKDAVAFLERIWEKVKVFFKDLVEFLSYLFDWKDIIATQKVLVKYGEGAFDGAKDLIEGYRKVVIDFFEAQKETLKQQKIALDDKYKSTKTFADLTKGNKQEGETDPKLLWTASKSEVMFGGKAVQSSGASASDLEKLKESGEENDVPAEIINLFIDFFKGNISVSEFSEKLMNRLMMLAVTLMEYVINKIFDWIIGAIDLIKKILFGEVEVPILSYIYKKATGQELSIAGFIALLIAIPMTVGYKLAYNEAPFQEGDEFNFSPINA
jgi:hypothetical protein